MDIGFIGLGKMGLNMVTRLQRAGHQVTAYDRAPDALAKATAARCTGVSSLADLVQRHVPVPTLSAALFTRFRSRQAESFAEKLLAALRNAFGGHAVRR